jgi:hypothetical protein
LSNDHEIRQFVLRHGRHGELGYTGTPINERRYSQAELGRALHKVVEYAKCMYACRYRVVSTALCTRLTHTHARGASARKTAIEPGCAGGGE